MTSNKKAVLGVARSLLDVILSVAASVVLHLLLISGDIEENPGPRGMMIIRIACIDENLAFLLCSDLAIDYSSVDAAQTLGRSFLFVMMCISVRECRVSSNTLQMKMICRTSWKSCCRYVPCTIHLVWL